MLKVEKLSKWEVSKYLKVSSKELIPILEKLEVKDGIRIIIPSNVTGKQFRSLLTYCYKVMGISCKTKIISSGTVKEALVIIVRLK